MSLSFLTYILYNNFEKVSSFPYLSAVQQGGGVFSAVPLAGAVRIELTSSVLETEVFTNIRHPNIVGDYSPIMLSEMLIHSSSMIASSQ